MSAPIDSAAPPSWSSAVATGPWDVLWQDGERLFCRSAGTSPEGERPSRFAVLLAPEHPSPVAIARLAHEYGLRDHLDRDFSLHPLELVREHGRTLLLLESGPGLPLHQLLEEPLEPGRFLRLASSIAAAISRMHRRGLIHKDVKPIHIFVDPETDDVRLTGFGIATRLQRERQAPGLPELIAGTLAYMAPEQTGRMNRSIDPRSDLYSLGVVLYEMITGSLPFVAADPVEWVHCHIARRPLPPAQRSARIPAPISAIIMKLLAKAPEDRYQTAAGAENDLRNGLTQWETKKAIVAFELGQRERPERLATPERLYGRSREIEELLSAFGEVVTTGGARFVLVAGYSGVGKSSVVNELHKALVPARGLFASGKFDQYKVDVPYAPLAQAFQRLLRPLLMKGEDELGQWRDALNDALRPNAALLADLVPELELVIGEQPAVVELSAADAQRRFQQLVRRFIGVFARAEHPLTLFLDDLQWLDAATLDLVFELFSADDVRHLLLIGAYRDNEVTGTHPFALKLDAFQRHGSRVRILTLAPLVPDDLGQLVADALSSAPDRVRALTELLQAKTGGNPFFTSQFLNSLVDEGLLAFEPSVGQWSWDRERTLAKGYSDNVVDLMVRKLARLPRAAQRRLQQLACLGNASELDTLCVVSESSAEALEQDLWQALHQELIVRADASYRFVHDRVREAAYSSIPEGSRAPLHLEIGRRLAAHTPIDRRKEAAFEIVNQLNRAGGLISAVEEREELAELNLLAAKRAKRATAYSAALEYLRAGSAALPEDAWHNRRELAFSLELDRAECEFLTSDFAGSERRLRALWSLGLDAPERASVTCLLIDLCVNLGRGDAATAIGLDCLRHLGVEWSEPLTAEHVAREYELVWLALAGRNIEDLVDLPRLTDPRHLGMLEVLVTLTTPAWCRLDRNLLCLVTCRAVSSSLTYGNSDASCVAFAMMAVVAGVQFGDYEAGHRFGSLAHHLVDRYGFSRFQARTYLFVGNLVLPWTRPFQAARDVVARAHENANQVGNLSYAAFTAERTVVSMLIAGDPLEDTHRQIDATLAFARSRDFFLVILCLIPQLGLVRSLRGLSPTFGSFNDDNTDERQLEAQVTSNPLFAICDWYYWVRNLQVRFFASDFTAANHAAAQARRSLQAGPGSLEEAEYHFYAALSLAAPLAPAPSEDRSMELAALGVHHRQLAAWAEQGPGNFASRAALVAAEIARLEGRSVVAMRLYDDAIHGAQAQAFVHVEAVAYEIAGRFYAQSGFEEIARHYLRSARQAYVRWGAHGKAHQLDRSYLHLRDDAPAVSAATTIAAPIEHLDLATVLKVAETVSSEIALDKLIDAVMRAALEHAGAGRGLLILSREEGHRIEAEANTDSGPVRVSPRRDSPGPNDLPMSLLHYVTRTRAPVLLDDACADDRFAADEYIRRRRTRSVLCLPLVKQARLVGVLYLENDLSTDVFTPARNSVLELLAFEAAISLENSRLYDDLQRREARMRRMVDSNIIGIFTAAIDGHISEANEAFLRIVGYDREDLGAGRLLWTELTPADWRWADDRALEEIAARGFASPYEKQYVKKDGTRVSVWFACSMFEDQPNDGVALVVDLTDRKRAEQAARDSEQRYLQIQMELAHANRVSTVGQLSASIAHEVNQPLSGIHTNLSTCLRMLSNDPPNLEGARETIRRGLRDTNRAADVIQRLRALFSKADTRREPLDVNAAIREVTALSQSELRSHHIELDLQLSGSLPVMEGDRIQMQQVMLNLVQNALDAMATTSGDKRLLIRSETRGEDVVIAVADSGQGVDPADLERVFDAFYSTKSGGLGVGLSICRGIIEAHGGKIAVKNAAHGGAVFELTLPAQSPDAKRLRAVSPADVLA